MPEIFSQCKPGTKTLTKRKPRDALGDDNDGSYCPAKAARVETRPTIKEDVSHDPATSPDSETAPLTAVSPHATDSSATETFSDFTEAIDGVNYHEYLDPEEEYDQISYAPTGYRYLVTILPLPETDISDEAENMRWVGHELTPDYAVQWTTHPEDFHRIKVRRERIEWKSAERLAMEAAPTQNGIPRLEANVDKTQQGAKQYGDVCGLQ
ncbi:hypothetical protein BCR34DRAFT_597495 [Clohesyomyces aquaticus]|uniref:Uncharacterized protein n=1 Tax=Clohesyomyces aquaticus TaxID=1231657 RepID=A0A1Y2A2Q6_9PLEO|nr:hypothetical protein BCR34DRAFT_597495 [Clohesyomyces aquaticus]